jgi:activating signal cointegrator complex subunit 3
MKQVKDEGWWLVIGNPQTWELYALKRVSFLDHLNSTLVLPESVIPHQVQLSVNVNAFAYM